MAKVEFKPRNKSGNVVQEVMRNGVPGDSPPAVIQPALQTNLPKLPPIWGGKKIEVIGLSGELKQGKSLFMLTIDPAHTLVYDFEGSCSPYESLGFERVDVAYEMMKAGKSSLIDLWHWFINDLWTRVIPGKYSVVGVDPISEIEAALEAYLRSNPSVIGLSADQIKKSSGLFWGAYKNFWKGILDRLRVRTQSFVFTVHMRDQWQGNSPTGKREAKGKDTLYELCSLYMELKREKDTKGNVAEVPSAKVLGRLAHAYIDETGKPKLISILPPRMPVCTPEAIREYIEKPADYGHLSAKERLQEEHLSDDEKLRLQASIASAEAARAEADLTKTQLMEAAAARAKAAKEAIKPTPDTSVDRAADVVKKTAATAERSTPAQQATIREMLPLAFPTNDGPQVFKSMLKDGYGVDSIEDLTPAQAEETITGLGEMIAGFEDDAKHQAAISEETKPTKPTTIIVDESTPVEKTFEPVAREQLDTLHNLAVETGWPEDGEGGQIEYLAARNAKTFREISKHDAAELIENLIQVRNANPKK